MRATPLAVVAVVAALLGGALALVVGKTTGWLDGGTTTVLVPVTDGAADDSVPAADVPASAEPLPGNDFAPSTIYRARSGGVVTIIALFGEPAADGQGGASQGSGFVVSPKGYILTNSHVITTAGEGSPSESAEPAGTVYVEFRDGDRVEAKIVGWDIFDDVGLLKVDPADHDLEPVPLGDSSRIVVGEPVAAIGSPFGLDRTVTAGIVAATERSIDSLTSEYTLVDAIQTDAEINRGNSGGPLFDARGRVIGVNAQIRSESGLDEGVGFAVPINSARRSMSQLIATGEVRYAYVGITTQTVTASIAERFGYGADQGAAVQEVNPGTPAAGAGFRPGGAEQVFEDVRIKPGGDLIVSIDGRPVDSADDVVRAVTTKLPGQKLAITVLREGERRTISVTLGTRPERPPEPSR
ncbi:MAG TPA: trypsin-like peptidase domain-containing protein [Gaiellaceae bacterium]|nr:trypsin-like peptidase domain-containing protein [Gaiellaceae bacterium]